MVTLKNETLTVQINEIGAEIKSVTKNGGMNLMWPGSPEVWNNTAPLMFPICGGLKEDKYILDGKEYTLPKHGFTRNALFTVEETTDTKAVFLLRESEETLKGFPFRFELRVIYTIADASINVEYKVDNKDSKTMYFSIGSHEAYYTPEGIEDYDVIFPQKETLDAANLYGNIVAKSGRRIITDSDTIALYDKYFIIDALVFTTLKSRSATLRNRKTGRSVKVDFPFANYFLLWHKHGAPYMCLEPWSGIPDIEGSDYDITHKEGITALSAGDTYLGEHTITFID